jgi:hypothetical protein
MLRRGQGLNAAAMAASRRGAQWRLPFMSLSSCRASERDPVALAEGVPAVLALASAEPPAGALEALLD